MEKIIIKNETDLSIIVALDLVKEVIKLGRISNNDKQYCYLTSIKKNNCEYNIVSDLRQKSDVFTIYKAEKRHFYSIFET